jgi:type II secretory pathway pseudopilin PulG
MRRYSVTVRRWLIGVLATFGVTAAIAVPLLTGSGQKQKVSPIEAAAARYYRLCGEHALLCPPYNPHWFRKH